MFAGRANLLRAAAAQHLATAAPAARGWRRTAIGVAATDAALTKAQAKRLALNALR